MGHWKKCHFWKWPKWPNDMHHICLNISGTTWSTEMVQCTTESALSDKSIDIFCTATGFPVDEKLAKIGQKMECFTNMQISQLPSGAQPRLISPPKLHNMDMKKSPKPQSIFSWTRDIEFWRWQPWNCFWQIQKLRVKGFIFGQFNCRNGIYTKSWINKSGLRFS